LRPEASPGKVSERLYLKHKIKAKKTVGVDQVVEQLPNKRKVLISSITKRKKYQISFKLRPGAIGSCL
jgi:hypothetical protein